MEQRSESETPVNLNALLIGEKTVPKGCRVMHVSSHGMLLHCEPDGRPRTFKDGDSIDIHLTVQHNGEQKKLTIPSHVRHVADNSLDVEFHHPDPVLLDLIESYRTSTTHKLEASVGDLRTEEDAASVVNMPGIGSHSQSGRSGKGSERDGKARRSYLIPGLMTLTLVAGLLGAGLYLTGDLRFRISTLEQRSELQYADISALQETMFNASLLEGKYASVDARVTALSKAFASLDERVHSLGSKEPAPVAATPARKTSPRPITRAKAPKADRQAKSPAGDADKAVQASTIKDKPSVQAGETGQRIAVLDGLQPVLRDPVEAKASDEPGSTAVAGSTVATPGDVTAGGPWAINLMSSRDKGYIEKVARQAESRGISTIIVGTRVKGKEYWRLQVPGFASLGQAKTRAVDIKTTLGIKEVWFLKRKPVQ
ncbi:MAG: SPOR domain-containing protein [Gammaproteobacteria bacterium]|nr:SPOR domain-containing protein [Gammaproteobacteria bacterium]